MFGALIAVIVVGRLRFNLNAVLAFWAAYILTRPLGASIGDYLTAARQDGGLGLGTNATSAVFLVIIVGLVAYLTKTGRDAPRELSGAGDVEGHDPVLKV
jgi:uncharacterized membrane-anchored protein